MNLLRFPELRQNYDYDCGANVIQSLLAYYGIDKSGSEISKLVGTSRGGTSVVEIKKVLKKFGLKTKACKMDIKTIKKYLHKNIPVIIPLQAWSKEKTTDWKNCWKYGHYVIAIGYDDYKFYFEDPAEVTRTYLTYEQLKDRWHLLDPKTKKKYLSYGIAVYGKKPVYSFRLAVPMG